MKLLTKISFAALIALGFSSCSDDAELKNLAPTNPVISYPANSAKDITVDAILKWNASTDPEKSAVKYDVYIAGTEKFTDEDIKSKDQTETEFKATLSGHSTYFWKVVAKDVAGGLATSETLSFTTSNSLPSVVTNLTPANEAKVPSKKVTFKWDASVDSDKDAVKYNLYLSEKKEFTESDIKAKEIIENTVDLTLESEKTYFWQIETVDSEGGRTRTSVYSFSVVNNLPVAPVYSAPLNDAVNVIKLNTIFTWAKSTGVDKDAIKYNLYISKKNTLSERDIKASEISETSFTLTTELEAHTKYFWQVEAVDAKGMSTKGEIFSFRTLNSLSTQPVIGKLVDSKVNNKLNLSLSWEASTDPDNDVITYDVYVSKDKTFAEVDVKLENLSETKALFSALDFDADYFLKVVAKDGFGAEVNSEVKTFNYNANSYNISVEHFSITKPVEGFVGGLCLVEWENAGNDLKYDLVISANSDFSSPLVSKEDIPTITTNVAIKGAKENSTLYVRVIAKDELGKTLKSNDYNFTYKKFGTFTDARDNKVYKTVNIDGKVWLAENFAFLPVEDTKPEVNVPGDYTKNLAYADMKEHANYKKYGLLYSVNAINKEGIIPTGWHIATHKDWCDIEKSIGMTDDEIKVENDFRGTVESKLKSETDWTTNGSNESGLNLLPAGYVSFNMFGAAMRSFGDKCLFWTATNKDSSYKTYYRLITDGTSGIKSEAESTLNRYSVRLVKD